MRLFYVFLLTNVLLLSGCSLFQPEIQQRGTPKAQSNCQWNTHRGIAELLRIEDNIATMRIYPADFTFQVKASDSSWQRGDEFKALIKKPADSGCNTPPQVIELAPVFSE